MRRSPKLIQPVRWARSAPDLVDARRRDSQDPAGNVGESASRSGGRVAVGWSNCWSLGTRSRPTARPASTNQRRRRRRRRGTPTRPKSWKLLMTRTVTNIRVRRRPRPYTSPYAPPPASCPRVARVLAVFPASPARTPLFFLLSLSVSRRGYLTYLRIGLSARYQ